MASMVASDPDGRRGAGTPRAAPAGGWRRARRSRRPARRRPGRRPPRLEDLGVDPGRGANGPAGERRASRSNVVGPAHGPVQGDPRHHLGVGEVAGARPAPPRCRRRAGSHTSAQPLHQGGGEGPGVAVGIADACVGGLVQGVEHLTEDVDLELAVGVVAGADGGRALVARQARAARSSVRRRSPGRPVHDLDLVGPSGHRPQQPAPPGVGLLGVAGLDEGEEGVGRVAQPAVGGSPSCARRPGCSGSEVVAAATMPPVGA